MDQKKRPTLKTIASIAGVSIYTVSRALGGHSDVSEETASRIRQIAKDICYTPNAYARNLSMRKTNTIGMIVPAIGADTAYNEVINAATKAAATKGICIQLGCCDRDIELEKAYCHMMCENRVGALIVVPISSEVSHIKNICEGLVPLIFFGGKTGLNEEYSITIDYSHSARIAVQHLYELGHRNIALFLYNPNNRTIEMKQDGYLQAMQSYGLTPAIYTEGSSDDTFSAGFRLTEKLIQNKDLPTAIWCASDLMAFGVTEALKKHGISIPEDISVIGHDNLFFTKTPSISLTTFSLPKENMGIHAVNLALSLMLESDEPVMPNRTFFAELIKRESSGPAAVASPIVNPKTENNEMNTGIIHIL